MTIDAIFQMQERMTNNSGRQQTKATAQNDFTNIFNRQLSQRNQSSQVSQGKDAIKGSRQRPQSEGQLAKASTKTSTENKQQAQGNAAVEERPQKNLKGNGEADKTHLEANNEPQAIEKEAIPYELLAEEILALLSQLNSIMQLTDEEKALIADAVLQLEEELINTQSLMDALTNILSQLEGKEEIKLTPEETAIFMDKLSVLLKEEKHHKEPLVKAKTEEADLKHMTSNAGAVKPQKPMATDTIFAEVEEKENQALTQITSEAATKEPVEAVGKGSKTKEQQEPVKAEAKETAQQSEVSVIHQEKAEIITKFVNAMQQDIQKSEPQNLLNQIVNKVELLVHNNKSEIKMKLSPEALGSLSIEITVEKGVMTAKVFTENYQVKELIENNLNQLKINLGEKGINVSSLEVNVGQQQESFQFQQSQMQQQRQKLKRLAPVGAAVAANYMEDAAQAINPYVINSNFEGLA